MEKTLKICWIKNKGNYIRFYFTTQDDYWGDDWNDAPWEDNAGDVYAEYVERYIDIVVPWHFRVTYSLNDLYDPYQSDIAVQDLVDNNAPFIYVTGDCYAPEVYNVMKKAFCNFSFNESIDSFWEKVDNFYLIKDVDLTLPENKEFKSNGVFLF